MITTGSCRGVSYRSVHHIILFFRLDYSKKSKSHLHLDNPFTYCVSVVRGQENEVLAQGISPLGCSLFINSGWSAIAFLLQHFLVYVTPIDNPSYRISLYKCSLHLIKGLLVDKGIVYTSLPGSVTYPFRSRLFFNSNSQKFYLQCFVFLSVGFGSVQFSLFTLGHCIII